MKSATWVRIASFCSSCELVSAQLLAFSTCRLAHTASDPKTTRRVAITSRTRISIRLPRVVVRSEPPPSARSRPLASVSSSRSKALAAILDLARVMGNHPTGVIAVYVV
jgi:hypothetical protein